MSGFAFIHNLGEAAAWTAAGTDAEPRLEWTASDLDSGDGVAAYWVRIYNASSGTEGDGTQVYSSGEVAGNPGFHNAVYGMKNKDQASNERWWTIKAKDNSGEWSAESSRTAFKVNWAQVIYEHNVGIGAASLEFSASNVVAGTQSAFLYRSAAVSGGTPTSWQTSIGSVPFPNASLAYLNILVRIATYTSGTQPALPDMSLLYATASQQPDNWSRSPSGGWALDLDNRRYGNKAYKCIVGSAAYHYVEPFRMTAADGIPVVPDADYVFSGFVKTNAPLTGIHVARLEVRDLTTFTDQKHGLTVADEFGCPGVGATQDSSDHPEGWQRLHVHYRTGASELFVRPILLYTQSDGSTPTNNGDVFWADAWKWEEGSVVSPWTPGFMSPALVIDSFGLQADGTAGAKVGLRTATDSADLDQIVNAASHLHFGAGSPEGVVTADIGHLYLRSDGSTSTTAYVKTASNGANTGWTAK